MFHYLSCFNSFLDDAFSLICPTWIHIVDERIELQVAWSKKIIYYERDRSHYCYYYINFCMIYFFKIKRVLSFGDVNLLFDQPRKRFERLLLQANRSRFVYQTEILSASWLFLYMPIFVDLLLICGVLFDVIDVS